MMENCLMVLSGKNMKSITDLSDIVCICFQRVKQKQNINGNINNSGKRIHIQGKSL